MKNIDILPISDDAKRRLRKFADEYRKQARIYIEIKKFDGKRLIVWAEQKEAVNTNILTKKELVERVREMFADEIPADWKLTVSAVNYDIRDIEEVGPEWIAKNMQRLGLKAKDIISHTGVDKSTLSLYLSGDREMAKMVKAGFYYLFKYIEMSNFDPGSKK